MSSTFQNPRNPLAAFWASAVEKHLREKNPDLDLQQIRQLPMMQGAYEHLSQLKEKKRVTKPPIDAAAGEAGQAQGIAQMAYLSQSFFDVAVTTAAFSAIGNEQLYEKYIDEVVNTSNAKDDIANFSTDDLLGFALCVIIWVGLVGLDNLNWMGKDFVEGMIEYLDYTPAQEDKIRKFWDQMEKQSGNFKVQYRSAKQYTDYQVIPWKIPDDAQIVMLGDWGTALDDAREFLKAIWRQAYQKGNGATIVFIHLGDIYYCGLPYECKHNFYDVFVEVGQELQAELGGNFNPNPPIFTLPGNHEYYSYGYGYFELLDTLNQNVPGINPADLHQQCSFFCLQTANGQWQFLGMDTGLDDGNAVLSAVQAVGDVVKGYVDIVDSLLPDWDILEWGKNLAYSTFDDYAGPFQPALDKDEINWHKQRLQNFSGKTILLSHHQVFSREAKINNSSPEYRNTDLYQTFDSYYKDKIAAWYWGHEHTFAVYMDGLWGLNKGRLLGSSSYEATMDADTPYANNYPMVPFADTMKNDLVKNINGLYYHTGAIMTQHKNQNDYEMDVRYYQFPAWTQLDNPPADLSLTEITQVRETITKKFISLAPTWIGNAAINENHVTTDQSPSITSWNGMLYMLYTDNGNNQGILTVCSANAAGFQPEKKNSVLKWSNPVQINAKTGHSPAIIAVNGYLYGFYLDSGHKIQCIVAAATTDTPTKWSLVKVPDDEVIQAGDAALAVCYFQGRIYILYRKKDSPDDQWWAYFDVDQKKFHDFGPLKGTNTDKFESPNTPALAADAYHIYMAYQGKDTTDICWAVATPSSDAVPSGTANNLSWKDKGPIYNAEGNNPDTSIGLTLEYANGVFLLVYTAAGDSDRHNLTQLALTGTGKDNTGKWIGRNTVKVYGIDTGKQSTASSSRAPALAIIEGGGLLVYRGNDHDEIYWAYY